MKRLDDDALDQIFRKARTHNKFRPDPIPPSVLRDAWDLARWGPTSSNSNPARVLFVVSPEAKARLEPALSRGNRAKTMAAPATAIFAFDMEFYEKLPKLFLQDDARSWFAGKPDVISFEALRSGTLQAAYFMLAARAIGLDCGPMGGFNRTMTDRIFFEGTSWGSTWRSNFLCNLGIGDPEGLRPRNPRLDFDEACRIL